MGCELGGQICMVIPEACFRIYESKSTMHLPVLGLAQAWTASGSFSFSTLFTFPSLESISHPSGMGCPSFSPVG